MKSFSFEIPIYDIHVDLVQIEGKKDTKDVLRFMRSIKCDQEDIDYISNCIERGLYNGGNTLRNFDLRRILVIFTTFSDEETREEVYAHEKRHIEDRVMEYVNVNDIESAGLLAGFLARKFYQFKKKLSC